MPTKLQKITDLYHEIIQSVTQNPKTWTNFLRSASSNYKCRFDEQVLIYAQRPDATAVLEIERWNKQFGRWVNKGARGIAVFDDENNGKLRHYFDISDTNNGRVGNRYDEKHKPYDEKHKPVPLWQMKPEFEQEVIEALENSFGKLEDKSSLGNALISAAAIAVEVHLSDYFYELLDYREGSFLEGIDEDGLEGIFRETVQSSVEYMLLVRCGIEPSEYYPSEDFNHLFRHLIDFNTQSTVNALGLAAGDIVKSCLREISATVLGLQKLEQEQSQRLEQNHIDNRTFESLEKVIYNEADKRVDEIEAQSKKQESQSNERSATNDQHIDVPRSRGRESSEPSPAGGSPDDSRQVRLASEEVSQGTQESFALESSDIGNVEQTSSGNRAGGGGDARANHQPNDGSSEHHRNIESRESNEVGSGVSLSA